MSGLRQTPFNRALYRPNLIWGGERELMIFAMCVSVGHAITSMNLVGICSGVLVGVLSVWGLRKMAKIDPQMSKVYVRSLGYQRYYPPFSRPYRTGQSKFRFMKGIKAY